MKQVNGECERARKISYKIKLNKTKQRSQNPLLIYDKMFEFRKILCVFV